MTQETYTRQQPLELSIPQHITVAGAGGTGSWVAIFCAMSGAPNLYLYDPDDVEESNRNRLPFCQGSLARKKVEIVRDFILTIRPECNIVAVPAKLEGILLNVQLSVSDVIIDCTDNYKSQYYLYTACVSEGKRFIRVGYDGTHITVSASIPKWGKLEENENTNYTTAPSWVSPAVIAAALGVAKLEKFFNQEVSLDLSEIGIPMLQRRQSRVTDRCVQRNTDPTPSVLSAREVAEMQEQLRREGIQRVPGFIPRQRAATEARRRRR